MTGIYDYLPIIAIVGLPVGGLFYFIGMIMLNRFMAKRRQGN
jgi:hypothetical protein